MSASRQAEPHWAVRINYRNRILASLLLFATIGSHLHDLGAGAGSWIALATTFSVYPHLAYAIGKRSSRPLQAEIRLMLVDALLCCAWVGALGFPTWIGFILVVALALNMMMFRGTAGAALALVFCALGMAAGWMLTGAPIVTETGRLTTILSMTSLFLYLMALGHDAHARARQLRHTRDSLRENERALQSQLAEIRMLQARLEQQAERDPLTGLFNRRYLTATMERELARMRREGQPMSLMLIDLDHFKSINDALGHQSGDQYLIRLAALLKANTRGSDVVCRWGGDEFLVLLPTLPAEAAVDRAEQYRLSFEGAPPLPAPDLPGSDLPGATLSIGVAACPDDADTADALIAAADAALYRAKQGGRNRTERGRRGAPHSLPVAGGNHDEGAATAAG